MADICSEEFGGRVQLELLANHEEAESKQAQKEKNSRLRQTAMTHPLLTAAMELFDGRLIDIKVMRKT